MTKTELIAELADRAGLTKTATEKVLSALVDITVEAIRFGDEIPLSGLGKIVPVNRAERVGRNPQTGEAVTIPASLNAKLNITKQGKASLN